LFSTISYNSSAETVFQRVARGEQVLAFDPLFIGAGAPGPDVSAWVVLLDGTGDRSLGMEAAQLIATAKWLHSTTGQERIRVETDGIRSQTIALIAAAIEPGVFAVMVNQNAMKSLSYLLDKPVPFRSAPELLCLDLYKDFDVDSLSALASPTEIVETSFVAN
jgi:hypothetical protein